MDTPPPNLPSLATLRATLHAIDKFTFTEADEQRVRDEVCAVVRDMKQAGAFPEEIIILLRRSMADARKGPLGDRLLERMVAWCVVEYFGDPSKRAR